MESLFTSLSYAVQGNAAIALAGLATAETDRALRTMLAGSISTLLDAGLAPAAVMDLIPVKPLAEVAPTIDAAY